MAFMMFLSDLPRHGRRPVNIGQRMGRYLPEAFRQYVAELRHGTRAVIGATYDALQYDRNRHAGNDL